MLRGLLRTAPIACALLLCARDSAASPGSFVYVAAASPCTAPPRGCALNLYVYDADSSALVTTILLSTLYGASSSGIAISPDGSRVYVEVTEDALPLVVVVDATRHELINSVFFAPAGELAVSRDGHILFDADSSGISLYDTSTTQLITRIPTGSGELSLTAVAADPVRDRVYWTALTACGGNLHAYDTTLGSEVSLQGSPYDWLDAFVSHIGTRLYLTGPSIMCSTNQGGDVRIVDLATLTTIRDFSAIAGLFPLFPRAAVEAPAIQRMYVRDFSSIVAYDSNTFARVGQFAVSGATSVAVAADEMRAYVATAALSQPPNSSNSLTVLDLAANGVRSVIPFPGTPTNVVATPPSPASNVCSYRLATHQSSWSVNGGSTNIALTTNCAWTASSSASWARVSTQQSGTGGATLTISVDSNFSTTNRTATVTVGGQLITVTQASFSSTAPFGAIDTPADYATGLSGAIAVTGWALDDVGVKDVRIYRDPVAGETPGQQIFIGYATLVEGARPDVQAAYPSFPYASRAGWGLQLLTNMLPNQGTGTYRVYAFADDVEGQTTLLGFRAFSSNNVAATLPFGTIDTPGQGDTVSGTIVNFGWALSSNLIATDGSTIDVLVDGVVVGHPVYNNFRADIASLFPGFPNSNGAVGYYILDTTTLNNGAHTIAWVVRDSTGATQGIGSRFFTVLN